MLPSRHIVITVTLRWQHVMFYSELFTSLDLTIWFSMASLSTPKQSLRWTGGTAVTRYKSWLSENSQLTSCNYEFYEDMDAFHKLVSCNYGNSDLAWTHFYSSNKDSTILEVSSSRQPASSKQWIIVTNPVHALPVTHHQRSLAHHMDSCTTLTVAHHLRLHFP